MPSIVVGLTVRRLTRLLPGVQGLIGHRSCGAVKAATIECAGLVYIQRTSRPDDMHKIVCHSSTLFSGILDHVVLWYSCTAPNTEALPHPETWIRVMIMRSASVRNSRPRIAIAETWLPQHQRLSRRVLPMVTRTVGHCRNCVLYTQVLLASRCGERHL
jgi:hypothetical protein